MDHNEQEQTVKTEKPTGSTGPTTASIKTLHADPDNPREISTRALEGLGAATAEFGDLSGIVFNKRSQCLVSGHQRLKALRRAGATEWVMESETPGYGYIVHPANGERFPIRIVDWEDTKERAANLTANNPEISGRYTEEALGQLAQLEADYPSFTELALDELSVTLQKELAKTEKKVKDEMAEDQSGAVHDAFMLVIECTSEEHQREMIERFTAEGLKCRALT